MQRGQNPLEAVHRPPDPELVQKELAAILGSAQFRGSKRCQDFLSYVVSRTLAGEHDSLKERALATAVFGLKATVDLEENSIVRVGAREVRKRLAQYYMSGGNHDELWIELPPGSYVPVFQPRLPEIEPVVAPLPEPVHEPAPPPPASSRRKLIFGVAAGAVVLAVSAVLFYQFSGSTSREFTAFWRPVFDQHNRLLIVLANPIVYHPSDRARALDEARNSPRDNPYDRPLSVPPELLKGSDFVPVVDTYVGIGDCTALFRLGGLFEQHARTARVRLASKVDFNDLRDSVSVLIGAYTNRWSMELSKEAPLRFVMCGDKPCIVDAAQKKRWVVSDLAANGISKDDYILISRLPHSKTGGFVLIGAGITHSGTDEAGRILSDSQSLTPILRSLPSGWKDRNIQMVLYSKLLDSIPTPPQLLDYRVW